MPVKRLLVLIAICCSLTANCRLVSAQTIYNPNAAAQNNLNASSDPLAANDASQGYAVGSLWQNSFTSRVWIARSVAAAAAVWTMLELADHPGYIVGNWYLQPGVGPLSAGSVPGTGSIRLYPAYLKERVTINSLGLRVTTLSAAGNVQAAIYANDAVAGKPTGAALAATASMSTGSAASVNSAVSIQLDPGIYWWASNCDNGVAIFDAISSTNAQAATLIGSATQGNVANAAGGSLTGYSVAQTFGTWPNLTSGSFTEVSGSSSIPVVQFKVGSVP